MDDTPLGERELDVMGVLWDLSSGTVAEVRKRLPADLAYTTVLTILRNLEAKGLLRHESAGRSHRYFPRVARQTARRNALSRLIEKFFQGSPDQLLAHLVDDKTLTQESLSRARRRIGQAKKQGGGQ